MVVAKKTKKKLGYVRPRGVNLPAHATTNTAKSIDDKKFIYNNKKWAQDEKHYFKNI